MKRFYTALCFACFCILSYSSFAVIIIPEKYPEANVACNGCQLKVRNTKFFDDGGQNGAVGNNYSSTTFIAYPEFTLSLYFTMIDLPRGARINIYQGSTVNAERKLTTLFQIDKIANLIGDTLTVEYISSLNTATSKGWEAHIDEIEPKPKNATLRVASPPESDCPFAIPLCANNTVVALGGQYTDLGNINDDAGDCYSGTGSGGSVWYTFSPQASGPLDFTISPTGSTDYDFVLWDITTGCQDGKRNQLACNYSLYTGTTGMSSVNCNENFGSCTSNDCSNQKKGSDCNRFNNRVNVTAGKQYSICINFYSGSNDGFILDFKKEASSVPITDNTPPAITNAYADNCTNASNFHLIFSEWVSCATIQATDFTISGRTVSIVNTNCVNGRTNNIDISVSPALTAGTYTINAQGIQDLCNNNMNSNYNLVLGTPPNPTISTPATVCKTPGLFGTYNYSPSSQTITAGGGTSYIWYDGQTGPNAVFSATSPKTVTVKVINGACAADISTTINVDLVTVSLGPDQLYCGTPIVLSATPAIPGSTYTFYTNPNIFSNGTQIQNGSSSTLSVSPGATTTYRVQITTPNGCKSTDDITITTNPPANATINIPGTNYCATANPVPMTASPSGGVFSGPGVSNDTFYPARVGAGTYTINYSVTNGCGTFTGTKSVTVIAGTLPTVNLNPTYCVTDPNVTLSPTPTCGSFSGPGITTAGFCIIPLLGWTQQPVFSPSTAGVGSHTLTYSGTGCANTFRVQVLGPGAAPIISGAGGPYCTSSASITLSASPSGGTFSGPGISGAIFYPSVAGAGTHIITYTVTSCGSTLTNSVQIQVVSSSASATIAYTPSTFCNTISTPQNVTRTGSAGGTYKATPSGLTIDSLTGAIVPSTSTLGTYTVTYTTPSAGGCPASTTTASVTISSGITPTFNAIGPFCQSSTPTALPSSSTNSINGSWNPLTISTSTAGTSTYTFTPTAGQCATTKTVSITIKPTTTTNISQTICPGRSLVFNGNTITTAGTYRDTLSTSLGCDSFIVLTVSVSAAINSSISRAICPGQSTVFNGQTITTAGSYKDTLTSVGGCDSIITLTVSLKSTATTNVSQSICTGSSVVFNGNTITTAGTYRDTLSTSLGCDSFVVLTVNVLPAINSSISRAICPGQNTVFNGQTITTAGTYKDTLTSVGGCDSIITLTVTIKPTATTNISQSICQGSSIVFNGNTITTAGTYRDTLSTSLGCDSFVVLTVTIRPNPLTNISQTICIGSSIVFNGQTINTAGVYRDTLLTAQGCDSFIVLTLSVSSAINSTISKSICPGQSIIFNGQSINIAGTYKDTLTSIGGCDSIVTLTVSLNSAVTSNSSQSICQGSSIIFNGNTITTAGTYRDTLLTSQGCDSIIVLTVTVKPTAQMNISQTICQGSSVVFNGNTLTTAGIYKDTLSTSLGCDSIITLTLSVNPVKQATQNPSICQGNTITVGTHTYSVSGNYKDTLLTSLGCDSIVTTNLTVSNTPQSVSIAADKNPICQGEAVRFTATALNPATVISYQWFLNGNPVGANSSIYNATGLNTGDSVYVQIQSAGGCISNPISISNVIGIQKDSLSFSILSVSYCAGESGLIDLNISPSNYSVLWQVGTGTQTTINADTLRVNNTSSVNIGFTINYGNRCSVSGTVPVSVFPTPAINATVNNPVVRYDEEVQLDVLHSEVLSYNWLPASQVSNDTIRNPTSIITATSLFTVVVRDANNCTNSDTVLVQLLDDCQSEFIYIPSAFSPNGDGINDCFRVVSPPALSDFKLLIFNRWGEKLFETNNVTGCWDGTYKGVDVMGDSYVFLISFKCTSGKVISKKGTVSVVK